MLRKTIRGFLLSTVLVAAPALAQTSTTSGSPTMQPGAAGSAGGAGTSAGSTGSATGAAAAPSDVGLNFITQREQGVWRASELVGKDVYGSNNEDIGEVSDVLIGQNGQVRGVIVGVGGFLGLGETNVALPMQAFQFSNRDAVRTAGTQSGASGTGGASGAGTTGAGSGTAGSGPATTGTTAAAGQGPDAVLVVRVTKEQLQNAPRFNDGSRGNTGAAGSRGTTGAGTAPRQ
jgi:sporulation protein YlmC with PRC-barrel domain